MSDLKQRLAALTPEQRALLTQRLVAVRGEQRESVSSPPETQTRADIVNSMGTKAPEEHSLEISASGAADPGSAVTRESFQAHLPLSFNQQSLWLLDQMGSTAYL